MREGSARTGVRAGVMVAAVVLGALVGAAFTIPFVPARLPLYEARLPWAHAAPTTADWPRPARPGESVWISYPAGRPAELVVTAPRPAVARGLVRAFATRGAPAAEVLAERREGLRAVWVGELVAGPRPNVRPTAASASWLLARARWGRAFAGELPVSAGAMVMADPAPPAEVLARWGVVHRLALEARPEALSDAIVAADVAEFEWFRNAPVWNSWGTAERAEAWRRRQVAHAASLEATADLALAQVDDFQRAQGFATARERLVELEPRLAEAWALFAAPAPRGIRPLVAPVPRAWAPWLALGALLGALASAGMLVLGARLNASPRATMSVPEVAVPALSVAGPRLHLVCGRDREGTLRAALELAAHRLAAGDRVLLVDGSPRARLHERLGRDARWGLLECLVADMPVLGLVQYAGHPGLYLLPHGQAERAVGWSPLGRKLDEVLPHFGRVVLLLEPGSPIEVGDALRGRALEGWWAGLGGRSRRAADRAMARFGIVFHGMNLRGTAEAVLEALPGRVEALRPATPVPTPAPVPVVPAPRRPEPARPALEPIVLDCDLQVRQRLRFLAWTRRVQADRRRAELVVTT